MKKFFGFLFVMVLAFLCFACKKEQKEVTKIRLGSCGPTEGSVSIYGLSVRDGVKLAIKEINENGGVQLGDKKVPFELVDFINDDADSDKAAAAFNALYEKGVDVIVGATTSGATEGLISQAIKKGIPVITPSGTADKLTVGDKGDEREDRYNIYRACFYDSYQGIQMAMYAKQLGYTNAYVIYNSSEDYSTGLYKSFETKAKELGLTVNNAAYTATTKDFTSFWDVITAGEYDCVFVPDYYENVYNIVSTGRAKGYTGAILGADGWDAVLSEAGEHYECLENCFYCNHYFAASTKESVVKFSEKYQKEYNEEAKSFAALAYDSVYILKQAIEACGSLDYNKIIEKLDTLTFTNLVTADSLTFKDGSPVKSAVIITFDTKEGKEVEGDPIK